MAESNKPLQAPRGVPRFTGPTLVRHSEAVRFLWGDEESHQVSDWSYGGSENIASFIFSLRPGEYFKWSKVWKPLYDQHRFYYVVEGDLTIHDPETGDVAVARAGDGIYWRGNKWHFGYNFGSRETVVLDWGVPAEPTRPGVETEVQLSALKPDLERVVNGRYDLLGKWPMELPRVRDEARREGRPVTIRREDCLNLILGEKTSVLVSLYVSSEAITAGSITLLPGQMAEAESHPSDEVVFSLRGRLNVYLPDTFDWFELNAKDTVFIPGGTKHQYCNYSGEPTELFFAVAPRFR
jgi:quercetin dioxygenase-like cupin family protein